LLPVAKILSTPSGRDKQKHLVRIDCTPRRLLSSPFLLQPHLGTRRERPTPESHPPFRLADQELRGVNSPAANVMDIRSFAASTKPQIPWNHILVLMRAVTSIESHPCRKIGGWGVHLKFHFTFRHPQRKCRRMCTYTKTRGGVVESLRPKIPRAPTETVGRPELQRRRGEERFFGRRGDLRMTGRPLLVVGVGGDDIDQEGNAVWLCQLNATPEPQA